MGQMKNVALDIQELRHELLYLKQQHGEKEQEDKKRCENSGSWKEAGNRQFYEYAYTGGKIAGLGEAISRLEMAFPELFPEVDEPDVNEEEV